MCLEVIICTEVLKNLVLLGETEYSYIMVVILFLNYRLLLLLPLLIFTDSEGKEKKLIQQKEMSDHTVHV